MTELRAESLAILLLLLLFTLYMFKSKRKVSALLTLPLLAIPVGYLIADLVLSFPHTPPTIAQRLQAFTWGVGIGSAVTIVLGFIFSHYLAKKRGKIIYTVFCCIFAVTVGFAYFYNLYRV